MNVVRPGFAALLAGFALVLTPAAASAEEPSGSHGGVQLQALLDPSGRYGGGLLSDVAWGKGMLRGGGALGIGALSNADERRSAVFGTLGGSLWIGPSPQTGGVFGVLRLGGTAGARDGGLDVGLWFAPGLGYAFDLGGGAELRFELGGWLVYDGKPSAVIAPGVGLGW